MGIAPVGLLVIRAWVQEGSERPLRVEIRLTADTGRGFEHELTLSEPEPVEGVVRAWLADVLADPGGRPRPAAERDVVTRRSRHGHGTR